VDAGITRYCQIGLAVAVKIRRYHRRGDLGQGKVERCSESAVACSR